MFSPLFHVGIYEVSLYGLLFFLAAVAALTLGANVVSREKGSRISWWFFALAGTMSWWLLGRAMTSAATDPPTALAWTRFSYEGFPFLPTCTLVFAYAAVGRQLRPRALFVGSWTVSIIAALLAQTTDLIIAGVQIFPWKYYPRYGNAGLLFILFFAGCGVLSLLVFGNAIRQLPNGRQRSRLIWFAAAYAIGFFGVIDFLPAYGIMIVPLGHFGALGSIAVIGMAIRRFRLFDITPAFAATNIISTMRDALVVSDDEQRIRIVNDALCDLTGYTRAELLGFRMDELLVVPSTGDATLRCRDGESIPVALSLSDLSESGHRAGTVAIAHDLRERLEIETAMRAQEMARHAEKIAILETLVGGVAHEVRNPLFALSASLDAFERVYGDRDELRAFADVIRTQIARLNDLMSGLLQLSRPAPAIAPPNTVDPIVDRAISFYEDEARAKGVEILHARGACAARVAVEDQRLLLAVGNVVHNAVQHSPHGGRVTIQTESARDRGVFRCVVRDEGSGFDPDDLPWVFDPFFTRRTGGTGLGLSIARSVIEQHHGTVTAENHPDGGAVITIELPLVEE